MIETITMRAPTKIACASCDHAESGLASRLDALHLARFEQDKSVQVLRAGQTLFCEGGPAHAVYCVRSGRFKLFKLDLNGEPLVLRFAPPGGSLGLCSAVAGRPHEDTAEAIMDSTVCVIPIATFKECATRSPAMASGIMRGLALELREAHERMMHLAHLDVMQRAARMLLTMNDELQRLPAQTGSQVHIKHMDLAAMIGTTPESFSRVLHALRERGVIEVTREAIRITDASKLRAIARVPAEVG